MNKQKLIVILGGLLVLQVALAVGLNLNVADRGAYVAHAKLVTFDKSAVDTIRLASAKSSLVIRKQDGHWRLPDINFAANAGEVDRLLDGLAAMKKDWPVATTSDAAEHFKVSPKSFEREITLSQGDKTLAKVYIGDSPGLRKVYIRRDGDDDVHTVTFGVYQVDPDVKSWLDKDVLKRSAADITSVSLNGIDLKRDGDGKLTLNELKKDQQTDAQKAKDLVGKLARLEIQNVLGKQNKPEFGQDQPKDVLKLALKDGKEITYTVSKPKDKHKNYYVVKSSDHPNYFAVATYELDPVLNTDRKQLVQAKTDKTGGNSEPPVKKAEDQPKSSGG